MNNPPADTVQAMLAAYANGKRVCDVAKEFGMATGKAYYILRDAGCEFRRNFSHPHTEETKRRLSEALKGRQFSEETRKRMSEARTCHYDGMNGIGHLKPTTKGYVIAYVPDHPHARADGYVLLHTIVMERAIGRYLTDNEVVHHINHIRNDNRLENLVLMDKHKHQSMHMRERNAAKRKKEA